MGKREAEVPELEKDDWPLSASKMKGIHKLLPGHSLETEKGLKTELPLDPPERNAALLTL